MTNERLQKKFEFGKIPRLVILFLAWVLAQEVPGVYEPVRQIPRHPTTEFNIEVNHHWAQGTLQQVGLAPPASLQLGQTTRVAVAHRCDHDLHRRAPLPPRHQEEDQEAPILWVPSRSWLGPLPVSLSVGPLMMIAPQSFQFSDLDLQDLHGSRALGFEADVDFTFSSNAFSIVYDVLRSDVEGEEVRSTVTTTFTTPEEHGGGEAVSTTTVRTMALDGELTIHQMLALFPQITFETGTISARCTPAAGFFLADVTFDQRGEEHLWGSLAGLAMRAAWQVTFPARLAIDFRAFPYYRSFDEDFHPKSIPLQVGLVLDLHW